MKIQPNLVTLLAGAAIGAVAVLSIAAVQTETLSCGRFQMLATDNYVFKIDTATGLRVHGENVFKANRFGIRPMSNKIEQNGFAIIPKIFGNQQCQELISTLRSGYRRASPPRPFVIAGDCRPRPIGPTVRSLRSSASS